MCGDPEVNASILPMVYSDTPLPQLPGAIFQQDNVRPHTVRVSQDCLRTVTTLPWLGRYLDLSPIEHVSDHLRLPTHGLDDLR
ncbi:hypothetical protein TNCV_3821411 [Trichonephila clavipes]|nr:hypothetical protein TNCV_3821411 [Trichonephila clavipes]